MDNRTRKTEPINNRRLRRDSSRNDARSRPHGALHSQPRRPRHFRTANNNGMPSGIFVIVYFRPRIIPAPGFQTVTPLLRINFIQHRLGDTNINDA